MKLSLILISTFLFWTSDGLGQAQKKSINKDSLIHVLMKDFPEERKNELLKVYNSSSEEDKEMFMMILSMPRSSKQELIKNIDTNFEKINILKREYYALVPNNYIVSIEFNPENIILATNETIDLSVRRIDSNYFIQEWNLDYNSDKLEEMIKPLHWTNETLKTIKKLLTDANCVSIANRNVTTIGFARSGMGKYYFKLFDNNLTAEEINEYNDGCMYIFYKNNIVLEYGGGAIGAQCFPDE